MAGGEGTPAIDILFSMLSVLLCLEDEHEITAMQDKNMANSEMLFIPVNLLMGQK